MSEVRISTERLIAHLLVAVAVFLLLYHLLPVAWTYLSPFIVAIPFAMLVQPVTRFLEKRVHMPHLPAVLIPLILLLLLLASCIVWFLSFGINQLSYLMSHSNEVIASASNMLRTAASTVLDRFAALTNGDISSLWSTFDSLLTTFSTQLTSWAGGALSKTLNMAGSIPYVLLYLNFLFFGIYFIARDYDRLLERYHKGILGNPDTQSGQLTTSAVIGLMGWLRCQATYAILSVVVGAIYWTAFGYQYGILISVAAGILEFLPIVGNGTVYLPWGIVGLLIGRPRGAILALALYFGLLLIRRVTEPKLLSQNIGVSPLLSLMSMFAGLKFGGLLGMVGSPMIAAALTTLWKGDFRKTIRHDIQVIFHYLSERWHGMTAVPKENPGTQSSSLPAGKDAGKAKNQKKRRPFRRRS